MPQIELIPEVFYQGLQPYHVEYDNLPLKNIIDRTELINAAVDIALQILKESVGTQGTLANRLAQSIEDDGDLKATAIDEAAHNIGAHTDGLYLGVDYVRMLQSERDKLSLISDEATALRLTVDADLPSTTTVNFIDEQVELEPSDTIKWQFVSPNKVRAITTFPSTAAHQHFYDGDPVLETDSTYKVNSIATPYVEGTLRVYVNGIRLSQTDSVYVPPHTGPDGTWILTTYTEDAANGRFTVNRTLNAADIIKVDYDRLY